MPNHLHTILYFPKPEYDLNKIIGNGKRLMAYQIIDRLEQAGKTRLLSYLSNAVSKREKKKGQLHKVFNESFDAKPVYTDQFFTQKLNYIHANPVRGRWQLVSDYTDYAHSSASFYEIGVVRHFHPFDYRLL